MKSKQLLYKSEMLRHFYFGGILSCAELSILTQKSLPLTTKVLNELLEEGAIVETGLALSTGGRRPQTYALANELMYTVAVAMDQHITRIAIMDMQNNYVQEVDEYELTLAGNPLALQHLGNHITTTISRSRVPRDKIAGIGIGMPGFIDFNRGINHSFLKPPAGHTVVSFLSDHTRLPVFIDNDSSLIALAEAQFGVAKGHKNVMVINVSWGVGLGMILNGKLYRGDSGFAGEFSHIPVFTNEKICSCGKIGCLETEASLVVMVAKALEGIAAGRSTRLKALEPEHLHQAADQIMQAAAHGDMFAIELLSEIGYNIGRGIAILVHILNPGHIVLSGRGAAAGNLWLAPIQQAINENCIPKIAENTSIAVSNMGLRAELIGAASLVMEHLDTVDIPIHLKDLDKVA